MKENRFNILNDKLNVIGAKLDLVIRKLNKIDEVVERDCPKCSGKGRVVEWGLSLSGYALICENCSGTGKVRGSELKHES